MLLCEVVTPPEEQIESWFKSVNDYVIDNKSSSDFEVAIRKLLYVFPKCKYTGDLYRILNLDKKVKLAHTALNFLDIPTDDWKILKRTVHVIDAELEILAPFTNNVHLLGIGLGKEFYDTENLNRAFKRLNKTTQ